MSKAHRSLLEGTSNGQIRDNLNKKINNANNRLQLNNKMRIKRESTNYTDTHKQVEEKKDKVEFH